MESNESVKFYESMRKKRAELGLTQDEVGEKLSVTRQTVSNWENRKSYPDFEQLVRISNFYHISIDSLLKGDPELRKSLDSSKVERILKPLNYLLIILVVAMSLLSLVDIKETRLIMVTVILAATIVIGLVQHKMDRYIGYPDLPLKQVIKTTAFGFLIVIIIGGIIFFTVGHLNMRNTLSILLVVYVFLSIGFYALMKFGFHALHVSNEAKEHGITLDEWLVEEDKAKKNGMTMDEWLKEREANKSTTNESEEDNDDEDSK